VAYGSSQSSELERLRAEIAALRETAEKHRLLIETTDTGFVILDEGGRVLDANAVYVRMTGRERLDQILGRPVTEWTAPEDRGRNAAEVRRCLEAGAVRNLEIDYLGPDGRRTPIEINATVRRVPAGVTILTVCRDIAARRRAEEALRDSEERYRTTIDAMSEAIHVVDADLRIVLLNRTGERWLRGLGIEGEIVGRRIFEVFPFLKEEVREEYRRAFAGEGPIATAESNTVRGREVLTETLKIPIAEGGRVVRVLTAMRDTTEAARAEERLRQTEKMEALGRLAGGIAHDFNNQLSAVLGYAELLVRGVDDPQLKEHAAAIVRVAARAGELTRQLLTFARKGRTRSEPVDIHALIGEVSAMLGRMLDPRITVRKRLDAPRAVTMGDAAQLQSALLNLALNARDAMPEGGVLTFATDVVSSAEASGCAREPGDDGRRLRIEVSDTGVGMADEICRRLFEPFFTTKVPGRGTGMGLAAVYGAVMHHRGEIRVESEPGCGATFTVLLRLADAAVAAGAPADDATPSAGTGRVLVVDDDAAVLSVMAQALRALGYRVTTCGDGAAALARYREAWREIDLVLLDVRMPGPGGAAAFAEMRRINPDARAILCSGHPLEDAERRLVDDGCAVFIEKPFTMSALSRAVASQLGRDRR
jgi:PAS domain S-box-containing protein